MADLLLKNFTLEGITRCHLRRSLRARRMRIELRPDRSLLIVVPEDVREDQWLTFVLGKREWIIRNLSEICSRYPGQAECDIALPAQIELQCVNEHFDLFYHEGDENRLRADAGRLHVYTPELSRSQVNELLLRWLKKKARDEFTTRLHSIADRTGLKWNRLSIRGQKTRWGSCSAKNNLSLNFKLLFLPGYLVDHVLLHELVHTVELNHSGRFWSLMKAYDPDYMKHRNELKIASRFLPGWLEQL